MVARNVFIVIIFHKRVNGFFSESYFFLFAFAATSGLMKKEKEVRDRVFELRAEMPTAIEHDVANFNDIFPLFFNGRFLQIKIFRGLSKGEKVRPSSLCSTP